MLSPEQLSAFGGAQPNQAPQHGSLTPQQLAAFGGAQPASTGTVPPSPPTTPDGSESLLTTLKNAAENLPSSVGKQFKNLAGLLNPKNDIKVAKGLGQQIIGAFSPTQAGGDLESPISTNQAAAQSVKGGQTPAEVPVTQSAPVQAFNQLGDNFLGGALAGKGITGLKQKLESDPAGLALDLSMLSEGVGTGVQAAGDAGAATEAPNILSKAGASIQDIGHAMNPISAPFSAAGKVLSKFGSASDNLNTAAISSANDLGVKLPIEAQVGPGTLQTITNFLKSGIFGKTLKTASDTASNQLQSIADDTASKLSSSPESPTLGEELKTGLQNYQDTFNKTKDDLYNQFTEEHGSTPATIDNTTGAIKNLLERYSNDATPESQRTAMMLQKTLDTLKYGRGDIQAVVKNLRGQGFTDDLIDKGVQNTYTPTFNVLKSTRTSIGAMLDKNPELSTVYSALDDDRTASLGRIDPDAAAQIKKIDAAYAQHQQLMGTKATSLIQNSTPEQLVQHLISGNNSTTLNTLKQIVPPETYNGLGLSWIKSSLQAATDPLSGKLNVGSFMTKLNQIDEPTKNALFSPEQRSTLNETLGELQKVKTAQDALDKASGSGSFLRNSQRIRELSVIPLALMGTPYLLKALVADLGGEFLTSKMLSSNLGQQLLTTGSPALETAGAGAKVAGSVAGKAAQIRNLRP